MPLLLYATDLYSTLAICDSTEPARKKNMSWTWYYETKTTAICVCACLYRLEVCSSVTNFLLASSVCSSQKTGRLQWQENQDDVRDMIRSLAPHLADKETSLRIGLCLVEVELWRYGFTTFSAFLKCVWFKFSDLFYFSYESWIRNLKWNEGRFDNFVCIISNIVSYFYFTLILCLAYFIRIFIVDDVLYIQCSCNILDLLNVKIK
jgi:hypothetical protein